MSATGIGLKPVSFRKGRGHEPRLSQPYVPGRHSDRFWSEAEEEILRRYFPERGAPGCEVHLPGRSRPAIYSHAGKLGLKCARQSDTRQRIAVDLGFDDRLRARWAELPARRGAVNDLADELGVPRWWLTKRATRLGLTKAHRKEPPWTAAEDDLMRKAPLHDPPAAARLFRAHGFSRSPTAIVVRAKRLGLSRRATRGTLSATAAARILGVDAKTLSGWCIAGDIEASRRGTRRLPQQGGDSWDIAPAALRRFVLDNLERIDLRRVEKFAFVDLLVATEAAE